MNTDILKRIDLLEARSAAAASYACDPRRRLAKYAAFFAGKPWTCPQELLTPEKKARRDEKEARYRAYFDSIGLGVKG